MSELKNVLLAFGIAFAILLLLMLIFIFLGRLGSSNIGNSQTQYQTIESSPQPVQHRDTKKEPAPEIITYRGTASQLLIEFENNELAAEKKYRGKKAIISGRVGSISEDILGIPYLTLGDDYNFESVQCFFEKEDPLLDLSKGQQLAVKGTIDGKFIFNVLVNDCELL